MNTTNIWVNPTVEKYIADQREILYVMHGTFASFCELPQIKILLLVKKFNVFT